jgi:hypothetical protein
MKNATEKTPVLTKEFTVNGIVFKKGTRLPTRKATMFENGAGFYKNGTYENEHYFGYGKNLTIPAEYFAK